jgi:hypothetical protein
LGLALGVLIQTGCNQGQVEAKPAANAVTVPEGTPLSVRTTSALSTNTQQPGQAFTATLEQSVLLDGVEIAARGAQVEGRIVNSDKGGRVKGVATLTVRLTGLHTADDQLIGISTSTVTQSARTTKGRDAVEILAGSGIGAAIGAIAGGGRGAGIGAAAGGGAGTGLVLATRGEPAVIPGETVLNFELRAPVTISRR